MMKKKMIGKSGMRKKTEVESVKSALRRKKKTAPIGKKNLLGTGSTLLNLACAGNPNGGFLKGCYHLLVGDSASGKTFLSLTCLAEAAMNPSFNNHRFIYDGGEGGALMDIDKFFGSAVAMNMEPPAVNDGVPVYSRSVEEFYFHVDDALQVDKVDGRPFIYILDSMDVLSSEAEASKFEERKKAHQSGKEAAGIMTDNKAKVNSANLRKVVGAIKDTENILIILNQTRDSLGFGFETKTRSGGHALRFYATIEVWSSIKKRLKKAVKGKPRVIGIDAKLQVKKNRVTGRERTVIVPIYYSVGIDDIGSCVDYLVDEGFWKVKTGVIQVTGLGPTFKGKRESVVKQIEEENKEGDLRDLVAQVWDEVEKACAVKRKRRYK
jgi:RecA/RadA recombinase